MGDSFAYIYSEERSWIKKIEKWLIDYPEDVKLKLRTKKTLFTFKTDPIAADRLLRNIKCDVIEL